MLICFDVSSRSSRLPIGLDPEIAATSISPAIAANAEAALDKILGGFAKLGSVGLARVLPHLRSAALEVGNAVRAERLDAILEGVDLGDSSDERAPGIEAAGVAHPVLVIKDGER